MPARQAPDRSPDIARCLDRALSQASGQLISDNPATGDEARNRKEVGREGSSPPQCVADRKLRLVLPAGIIQDGWVMVAASAAPAPTGCVCRADLNELPVAL